MKVENETIHDFLQKEAAQNIYHVKLSFLAEPLLYPNRYGVFISRLHGWNSFDMNNEPMRIYYPSINDFSVECHKCQSQLESEDGEDGYWFCLECGYHEKNNITICNDICCDNFVKSSNCNFYKLSDLFCNVEDERGYSCLGNAEYESEQMIREEMELRNFPNNPI